MLYSRPVIQLRALIATLLAYLRAFVWAITGGPARPGDRSLSTSWLKQVLESNGYSGFNIKSVQIGENPDNRGLDGSINKLVLEYEPAAPGGTSDAFPPTRFILKTTQSGFSGRAKTICQRSYREAWFYASPIFRALAANHPRVFYSYGSALFAEMVVLAEDVSVLEGATPANFIFGNQVWGVPPTVEPKRDEVETLRMIFTQAARMHAAFWRDEALLKPQAAWLKHNGWYAGKGREQWTAALHSVWAFWKRGKARALDKTSGLNFSEKLIAIMDKSFETSSWEKVQAQVQNKAIPFTLTHGDFHASNMFVVRDGPAGSQKDKALWYDWSEVGPWEPTADLAQMFISDIKPSVMKENANKLVRAYYDELIKNGVSPQEYSWETCWTTFCENGAEKWIWLLAILVDYGLPTNAMQYFHDQVFTFVQTFCPRKEAFEIKSIAHIFT